MKTDLSLSLSLSISLSLRYDTIHYYIVIYTVVCGSSMTSVATSCMKRREYIKKLKMKKPMMDLPRNRGLSNLMSPRWNAYNTEGRSGNPVSSRNHSPGPQEKLILVNVISWSLTSAQKQIMNENP